jgi:DNA-binding protein H-NS
MDVDALLSLRVNIDKGLNQKRVELKKQLSRLGDESTGSNSRVRRGTSAMKGRKVAPKYRGPTGETWAGRGARPRWLSALMKQGRRLDEFAIHKSARGGKRIASKKSRRKRK